MWLWILLAVIGGPIGSWTESAMSELPDCCDEEAIKPNRVTVPLGYLTAVKGDMHNRQGRAISGALSYAVDQINNCSCILPDVKLEFLYRDTEGKENKSTEAMIDLICSDTAAFIGPEGPNCNTEAMVAGSKNRAMISYRCTDALVSNKEKYPTFTRMEPPDTQVTSSVLSLLDYHKWNKFSIVSQKGDQWITIADHLNNQAEKKGFIVNHYKKFEDENYCCLNELECCNSMWPHPILKETKDTTRIYVFVGQREMLVRFMKQMKVEQLFVDGKYMVIYLFPETAVYDELGFFLWNKEVLTKGKTPSYLDTLRDDLDSLSPPTKNKMRYETCEQMGESSIKQWRSLIVVSGSPYRVDTTSFAKKVREYNILPPFNFTNAGFEIFYKYFMIHISIYAAHLYDSVMLYAKALHNLIDAKKRNAEPYDVEALARDGRQITQTIIKMGGYNSISGNYVNIDNNGDSEGNFTAFALKPHNYTFVSRITGKAKFSCSYYPVKVGEFHSERHGDNSTILYSPKLNIDWPGNHKPVDEPHCGYDGNKCPRTKGQTEIAAVVLGCILVFTVVFTLSMYRKWKIEQEIEGLLWKINPDCLQGYRGLHPCQSKQSLGSVLSGESRGYGTQCQTARYRGSIVRIKELRYDKKKDIPRDVMKEMKLMREMRHDNINSFIGACVEAHTIMLITDFCAKGALNDILENPDIKLEPMFVASLIHDLIKGMLFLHNSDIISHGNLRSSNCVITSRWTLQVTDFGLHDLRNSAETDSDWDISYQQYKLLWKAPELLRDERAQLRGTQKGDVYSFGIIMYEIYGRQGPYGDCVLSPNEILSEVKEPTGGEKLMRPDINMLRDTELEYPCPDYVIGVMEDCWQETPDHRPDFTTIRNRLKPMKNGMKNNIMDQMVEMLEKYSNNLEDLVSERTRQLFEEKQKTEDLLHRMLPPSVAKKLTHGVGVEPEAFTGVSIYFSDIVGFTSMCSESTPLEVVNFLNDLYSKFDEIIQGFEVYKIETIGDAYMVVSGLPERTDLHAGNIASMALEILSVVQSFRISHRPNDQLKLRVGIHTGPVVAGVVGLAMPRYCLFGDTVNTASRMESNGEPLKIHISSEANSELQRIGGYITESRGLIKMKGKGECLTYWLNGVSGEAPIKRKALDYSKLRPLFCLPKKIVGLGNPNSQELGRRRSPRMSMISGTGTGTQSSFRERNTPDSIRNSYAQLAKIVTASVGAGQGGAGNGSPHIDKDGDVFRFNMDHLTARKLLNRATPTKRGSPRQSLRGSQTNFGSSSAIAPRNHHRGGTGSASSTPPASRRRQRPRSLSEDRSSFETMALLSNGQHHGSRSSLDDEEELPECTVINVNETAMV